MKTKLLLFLFAFSILKVFSQTTHLILVSDYGDKDFGVISLADEELMTNLFKKNDRIGYKLEPIYVNKTQPAGFNSTALKSAITALKVNPNDIVVFYYSGLGAYQPKSNFPFLKFDSKDSLLSLDLITTLIQKKGAKFSLVMADCRNTMTFELPKPIERNTTITADISKQILSKLYLENPCKVIKIASTKKNEPVLSYQNNSVFTFMLGISFEQMMYSNSLSTASFDKLFEGAYEQIKYSFPKYNGYTKVAINCKNTRRTATPR